MVEGIISCVIVEDDPVAQKVLEVLVQKTSFLLLTKTFDDPVQASMFLKDEKVELLFLDVEMPGMNGLQLLNLLDYKPYVIIVSAKEEYALKAFEFSVYDYLLKPLDDYPRFLKAVMKVKEVYDAKPAKGKAQKAGPLFVKVDSLFHNLDLNAILWIEAYGDYIKINTDQKMLMVLSTLKSIDSKLPEDRFVRVHRSYIVNVKRIDNIDLNNLQIKDKIIPISANYREGLFARINLL
ncbi:MAG: LytTR family DNA-binding domain-containing protein [Chryseolinea sp.]